MPGGDDPDNRRDFPGGFLGDPSNAFTASVRTAEQQNVFAHVQSLLTLRRAHSALRSGKHWHMAWDETYYAFVRELPEEKLLVVYNNASSTRELKIPVADTPLEKLQSLEPIFGKNPAQIVGSEVHVTLAPQTLVVFQAR